MIKMIVYDVCECIVTLSNFSLHAVCKVQLLNCVDKLLATTANPDLLVCCVHWQ